MKSYRDTAADLAMHIPRAGGADMQTADRHAAMLAAYRALMRAGELRDAVERVIEMDRYCGHDGLIATELRTALNA
jgi:uncharacterized protein (UPF0261 family)